MNSTMDDDVALDLVALGRALWRAKFRIAILVIGAAVLTFAGLQFVSPKYKGEAKLLIESRHSLYPGAERAVESERALLDQEGVASQVQLLRSYDLGRRVAVKLKLAERKEFNSAAGGGSLLSRVPVMLGFASDPSRASVEEKVLDTYFKRLKVYQVEKTRVITVEFSSVDRELAALAANTVVEEYLEQQASAKRDVTADAADQLEPEIARVRADVEAAERKVEEYRGGADLLLGANNVTLVQQQLVELNTQLAVARAARSEIQAKATLLRKLLDSGGSLESVSDVLNSPLIQRLRESQVALQARIAELSTSLLPNHPQFRALRRQLANLDSQIRGEAGKILSGMESDARISQARVESLLASLNELKAAVTQSNEKRIALRDLERDSKIKTAQLESLLTRYRDQGVRGSAGNLPDARVISRASMPLDPYTPRSWRSRSSWPSSPSSCRWASCCCARSSPGMPCRGPRA
ncbi:GumC family protein [Breoghania sp. L-A4]|uniref:GumC family protein n=1 Tax=Breoghania sp. L-A4 TaxID=2304600 RepID=UPI0013C2D3CC|nr:GumC family protein [Breoghania sp. L-A4]